MADFFLSRQCLINYIPIDRSTITQIDGTSTLITLIITYVQTGKFVNAGKNCPEKSMPIEICTLFTH